MWQDWQKASELVTVIAFLPPSIIKAPINNPAKKSNQRLVFGLSTESMF